MDTSPMDGTHEPGDGTTGTRVLPALDDSPAYDLPQSLHAVAGYPVAPRFRAWVEASRDALGDDERRRVRAWFGGDSPVGGALMALVPRLGVRRETGELLASLEALPAGDFLRLAVTSGYTDPDTPLDADDLLALAQSPARARAFLDRHLRVSGRARGQLLSILADPEGARAELLDLLRRHAAGAFRQIEPALAEERGRGAERLRELLGSAERPEWLRKLDDLSGFSPVLVTPSGLAPSFSVYYHEIRRPLFDDADYEPYLLLVGTPRLLTEPRAGRPSAPPAARPAEPAERYAALFQVFAEPTRLRMAHLLARRPWYGQELAAELGISGATANHHITRLMRAGLVRVERRARRTYFALEGGALREAFGASWRYLSPEGRDADEPPAGVAPRAGRLERSEAE